MVHVVTDDLDRPEPFVGAWYTCEDPTCDWCVTEFTGGSCKGSVNSDADLLTPEVLHVNSPERRRGRPHSEKSGEAGPDHNLSLFGKSP